MSLYCTGRLISMVYNMLMRHHCQASMDIMILTRTTCTSSHSHRNVCLCCAKEYDQGHPIVFGTLHLTHQVYTIIAGSKGRPIDNRHVGRYLGLGTLLKL